DYQGALRLYSDAIDNEPEVAVAHCERGYINRELFMWDRAAADFDRCKNLAADQELDDLYSEAVGMEALSLFDMLAETDASIDDLFLPLDDALESSAAPDWLVCERGERLFGYGFYDEAIDDFEACEENADGAYWQARSQIVITQIEGDWAYEDEEYETAVDLYSQLTYLEADAAYPHCLLGYAYLGLSDYGLALDSFNRCNNLAEGVDPDSRQWAMEGETAVQIQQAFDEDDFEAALRGYNRAIDLAPDNVWYFCERGNVFLELDNEPAARDDFQTCFDLSWDFPDLHDEAESLLQELNND
ncbi:hypothetical protein MNBD_CHLOROFLEXI01-2182, partial [hydrothermal vent metagenome]